MSQYASNLSTLLDGSVAALVVQEGLRPISGNVIFPPTYAGEKSGDKSRYNLNATRHGTLTTVDSIPSQANRIEPLFMRDPYAKLVPQVTVKAGTHTANLLEMGHRLADAAIRFTPLGEVINQAFEDYRLRGNASTLAKLGPTSLIFGVWDSRNTHTKVPRLLNAEITATDVEPLQKLSQFTPTFEYTDIGIDEKEQKKAAEVGLAHVPNAGLGGVVVHGSIQRTVTLNLAGLRAFRGETDAQTQALQNYLLGLALLATYAPVDYNLRQGCHLVRNAEQACSTRLIRQDGTEETLTLDINSILAFANQAATAFGVGENRELAFDTKQVKDAIKKASGKGNE